MLEGGDEGHTVAVYDMLALTGMELSVATIPFCASAGSLTKLVAEAVASDEMQWAGSPFVKLEGYLLDFDFGDVQAAAHEDSNGRAGSHIWILTVRVDVADSGRWRSRFRGLGQLAP